MTELTAGLAAPLGAHYDGEGINLPCTRRTPSGWSCACSTASNAKCACRCRRAAAISGMAICRAAGRGNVTVTGSTARSTRRTGSVSTPTSWRSIRPRAVEGPVADHPHLHGGYEQPDPHDSAELMPKCVVVDEQYDWQDDRPPATPWGRR